MFVFRTDLEPLSSDWTVRQVPEPRMRNFKGVLGGSAAAVEDYLEKTFPNDGVRTSAGEIRRALGERIISHLKAPEYGQKIPPHSETEGLPAL